MPFRIGSLLLLVIFAGGCTPTARQTTPLSSPKAERPQACLVLARIFSAEVLDNQTILFRMLDGRIWRNRLPHPCAGLALQQGFAYVTSLNQLCSLDLIRVLGPIPTVCGLGSFEPYAPAEGPGANPTDAPMDAAGKGVLPKDDASMRPQPISSAPQKELPNQVTASKD